MTDPTTTQLFTSDNDLFDLSSVSPGIMVARAPTGTIGSDRCLLKARFTVGRSDECDMTIRDSKMSQKHFRIVKQDDECLIEDLRSTNGTFVDGLPVKGQVRLAEQSVIRAGNVLFVYHRHAAPFMSTPFIDRNTMAGKFHTALLLRQLKEAAISVRHVLLAGETGTGKELAAHALAAMMGEPNRPLKMAVYNGARFASREEAISTLFGVAPRFFSGVDARPGIIETMGDGVLFLDELHSLPAESQRMILRIIEDGKTNRLGETTVRTVPVRFIIASNAKGHHWGLARDLFARLRLIEIPPLHERVADIPGIFDALLRKIMSQRNVESDDVLNLLAGDHYEALCLEKFCDANVRALVDLADRLTTRIIASGNPQKAVAQVFGERFGDGFVATRQKGANRSKSLSQYELNKGQILSTYRECRGNLSATERKLKSAGIKCTRRWLAVFLEKWGVRPS